MTTGTDVLPSCDIMTVKLYIPTRSTSNAMFSDSIKKFTFSFFYV